MSLTPSSVDATPVARITLKAVPDDPATDDAPAGDEKYRLTGEAARQFENGHASWYGPRFHGRLTASGERYDMYALTAAHKTLPFGTVVRVRSEVLGREVDVRINDRGPFAPGRVIDVSRAAAEALGLVGVGVAEVSLLLPELAAGEAAPLPVVRKARRSTRRAAPVKRR
jgi:rare lipoprotein A